VVDVSAAYSVSSLHESAPSKLFEGRCGAAANQSGRTYDVSLDGWRAVLNHPDILVVHDVGREGGTMFVGSELLEVKTLRDS
jgi:ribosomal protein L21E